MSFIEYRSDWEFPSLSLGTRTIATPLTARDFGKGVFEAKSLLPARMNLNPNSPNSFIDVLVFIHVGLVKPSCQLVSRYQRIHKIYNSFGDFFLVYLYGLQSNHREFEQSRHPIVLLAQVHQHFPRTENSPTTPAL
jgi:hypothetical protein